MRKEALRLLGGVTGVDRSVSAHHGSSLKRTNTVYGRILSVCSYCHRFMDDDGEWRSLSLLSAGNFDLRFSHGICPSCAEALYPELYEAVTAKGAVS